MALHFVPDDTDWTSDDWKTHNRKKHWRSHYFFYQFLSFWTSSTSFASLNKFFEYLSKLNYVTLLCQFNGCLREITRRKCVWQSGTDIIKTEFNDTKQRERYTQVLNILKCCWLGFWSNGKGYKFSRKLQF